MELAGLVVYVYIDDGERPLPRRDLSAVAPREGDGLDRWNNNLPSRAARGRHPLLQNAGRLLGFGALPKERQDGTGGFHQDSGPVLHRLPEGTQDEGRGSEKKAKQHYHCDKGAGEHDPRKEDRHERCAESVGERSIHMLLAALAIWINRNASDLPVDGRDHFPPPKKGSWCEEKTDCGDGDAHGPGRIQRPHHHHGRLCERTVHVHLH